MSSRAAFNRLTSQTESPRLVGPNAVFCKLLVQKVAVWSVTYVANNAVKFSRFASVEYPNQLHRGRWRQAYQVRNRALG